MDKVIRVFYSCYLVNRLWAELDPIIMCKKKKKKRSKALKCSHHAGSCIYMCNEAQASPSLDPQTLNHL